MLFLYFVVSKDTFVEVATLFVKYRKGVVVVGANDLVECGFFIVVQLHCASVFTTAESAPFHVTMDRGPLTFE